MKFLNRLGDTLLSRLAPETEAWAAEDPCAGRCDPGRCATAYTREVCVSNRLQRRCCYVGGSACPTVYCGPWKNCGLLTC